MNYYNEIKNELINNESYKRVKDYSKNKSDLTTYYNVGKLLSEAGKHYGEGITLSFDIIEQASYSGHTLLLGSSSSDYKKYNKTKCYDNATGRQGSTFRIKTVKITNKQGSTNSQITVSNISKSKTGSSVYWRDCNSGGLNEICQSGHGGSVYGWPGHDNPATLSWSFTTNATFNFIEIVPDWEDSDLCNDYRFSNIKFGLSGQEKYVK